MAVAGVPPALTAPLVTRLRDLELDFVAAHGVGEVRLAATAEQATALGELRSWTEAHSGSLVVSGRPAGGVFFDPWGTPPQGIALQRRVKAAFDPAGVANPGILPGGI